MANDGFVTVYSTKNGRKHRVPAHYMDNPVLSRGLSKTPRQRDADKAVTTAGGTRADHPDEPTATEPSATAAPTPEATDPSVPANRRQTGSTETPATRGEE